MIDEKQAREYVALTALSKAAASARDELKEELKARMRAKDRISADIGSQEPYITMSKGRASVKGEGLEFERFMRDVGMTVETVNPQWNKIARPTADGRVVWPATGEIIPGAWAEESEPYPVVKDLGDPLAYLADARSAGVLDAATMPLLGGE